MAATCGVGSCADISAPLSFVSGDDLRSCFAGLLLTSGLCRRRVLPDDVDRRLGRHPAIFLNRPLLHETYWFLSGHSFFSYLEGLGGVTGFGLDTGGFGGTRPAPLLSDSAGVEVDFCAMTVSYFLLPLPLSPGADFRSIDGATGAFGGTAPPFTSIGLTRD